MSKVIFCLLLIFIGMTFVSSAKLKKESCIRRQQNCKKNPNGCCSGTSCYNNLCQLNAYIEKVSGGLYGKYCDSSNPCSAGACRDNRCVRVY